MSEPLPVVLYWVLVDDCGFIIGLFPRREEALAMSCAADVEASRKAGPITVCPGGIQGQVFYEKP